MDPVIVRSSAQSFRTEIEANGHLLIADEPEGSGGTNAGPTPYDFLSGALGACTSMTVQIVAKREKIPLESIELRISNDRMHAKDCVDCLTESGYIHRFKVEIVLNGPELTVEHRARLLQVAGRCPVAKTLMNEIKIEEVLA